MNFEIDEVSDLDAVWPDLVRLMLGQIEFHRPYVRRELRPDWEERWREHMSLSGDRLILIARDDGDAIGFAATTFYGDYGLFVEKYGSIDDVFVVEGARGQGVGTALLSRAEEWCRERGAQQVRLQARLGNQYAVGFWAHCGFEPELQRMSKSLSGAVS